MTLGKHDFVRSVLLFSCLTAAAKMRGGEGGDSLQAKTLGQITLCVPPP